MPSMGIPTSSWTGTGLVPLYGKKAMEQGVNLAPLTSYPQGTILGPVTSSANDVQTITIGGTPTGGTFVVTGTSPVTGATVTLTPAYNVSTAALQAALAAIYGAGNVTVTGTAGTSYVLTAAGQLVATPFPALTVATTGLTGGTPTIANVHTTTGRSAGTFAPYASGNSDGSQVGKCIIRYACATDANGNIYQGSVAGASDFGLSRPDCPAFYSGYFRANDLPNLDSNLLGLTPARFVLINGALGSVSAQVELV